MGERTLTISETAEATGLSRKAIERRLERGSLRSVLVDGLRRVPVSELERAGLLRPRRGGSGDPGAGANGDAGSPGYPASELDAGELLARLERLAAENGRLRALEERAQSLDRQLDAERDGRARVEVELHRVRAEADAWRQRLVAASWRERRRMLRELRRDGDSQQGP